jgi:anti-sigma regulatory factor (Ser/Thr protein kinase)
VVTTGVEAADGLKDFVHHAEAAMTVTSRSLSKFSCEPAEVISALSNWVELAIPCTRDAAESIPAHLATFDSDLSDELRSTIGLALRELLYNAVEWGGKLDAGRKVRIAHIRFRNVLLYRIADPGSGFSFKGLHHAVAGQSTPEGLVEVTEVREVLGLRPGGFGIAMSQAIADEILYNEAQNEVILITYLR